MKPTLPTCPARQIATRLAFLTLFLLWIAQTGVFAQTIFQYTNASSGAPNYIDPNADDVLPNLARGAGVSNLNLGCFGATEGFGATGWPTTNVFDANVFDVNGDFIEFTIDPDPGYGLKITGFSARSRRENLTGTINDGPIAMRYGYKIGTDPWVTVNPGNPQSSNLCVSGGVNRVWPAWITLNTNSPVIFRIYGLSSGAAGTGDLFLRDIIVSGELCDNSPEITLTDNSLQVCQGTSLASLAYTATNADTYSIDYNGIAEGQGFTDEGIPVSLNLPGVPNGSIPLTIPVAAAPGIYSGTLTIYNDCGFSTNHAFTVEVWALPTAVLNGDQTICAGDEAPLNVTLTGAPDWDFELSNGSTYTGVGIPEPILGGLYPTSSITYTIVSLTDGNGCVAVPAGLTGDAEVTVNPLPAVVITASEVNICEGDEVTFTVSESAYPPGTEFTISATVEDNGGTNSVTFFDVISGDMLTWTEGIDFDGTLDVYDITATVEGSPACVGNASGLTISVYAVPDAYAEDKTICSGSNTNLEVTNPNDVLGSTFTWTAVYGDVTGGAGAGTGAFGPGGISETLQNNTNAPIVVTYQITPVGPAPTYCEGSFFDVFVTVEPQPIFGFSASSTSDPGDSGDNDPNTLVPNSICVDFCVGDFLTLNGYFDNGDIGYTAVFTTTGNVTYDGSALPLGGSSNVPPGAAAGFFGTTYGGTLGYGLSSGTYGLIDQRFIPYLDVDGSGTLTEGDCEGELVQLLYKIYAPIVVNVVRNDNNLCSGEQVDYTISTTSTEEVLFDLTLSENVGGGSPADLDDDNTLPVVLTDLSIDDLASYNFTQAINNAAGLFDRGRVELTISNVRYADTDVSCGATVNIPQPNTLIYPKPRLDDPADKLICTGASTDLDIDLLGWPSSPPVNTAGYPVRIEWTASATNVLGASDSFFDIYTNLGAEAAVNDIAQVLTLVNPLLNGSVTYTITPRSSGPTNAFNGDDCYGDPITVTVTVIAPAAPSIAGPTCVHATAQMQLTGTPNVNPPATLFSESWSSNSGNATVDATGLVTGVTPGPATISYTVTDDAGCVSTATYPIMVLGPLTLTSTSSSSNVGCGEEFTVSVAVTNFCDIGTLDYNFEWDETLFQFVTHTTPNVPAGGSIFVNTGSVGSGELYYSYVDDGFPPFGSGLPDGTVILTYTLRAIGNAGTYNVPNAIILEAASNSYLSEVPVSSSGVSIEIELLSLNLVSVPLMVCPSDDFAYLLFDNVQGSPNHYLIEFDGCPGFPATQEGALIVMDGQIVIPVPDGLQNGVCNATLLISNDIYGCESDLIPFSIIIDQEPPNVPTPDPVSQQCFPVPAPDINIIVALLEALGDDADNCTDWDNLVVEYEGDTDNGGAGCAGDPLEVYHQYAVTDEAGNTTYVTHTIIIEDTGFPTVETDLPNNWYPNLAAAEAAALARANETKMDNCSPPVGINVSFATVSTQVGCTWTVHLALTDACGNLTLADYTTVVDDEDPTIDTPDPIDDCYSESDDPDAEHYPYQDAVDAAIAAVAAAANDNCTDPEDLDISATTSGTDCELVIVVTVSDDCGRTATYTYNTRVESDGPYIPADPLALDGECFDTEQEAIDAAIALTQEGAEDDCTSPDDLQFDAFISGGCPAEIMVVVTDYCGNPSTITYTGVHIDTEDPQALGSPEELCFQTLYGPLGAYAVLAADAAPTDNCTSTEDLIASALDIEGDTPPTFTPDDPEAPCNEGTVELTFTDNCGNSIVVSFSGIIIDDEDPTAAALPDLVFDCHDEAEADEPNIFVVDADDNCGTPDIAHIGDDLPEECPGTGTRTYRVTDCAGNYIDVVQNIIVNDDEAPTFTTTPADDLDRSIPCGDEIALIAAQDEEPEAEDNCGEVTVVKTWGDFVPSEECPQAGTYTNTWTAYDDCGNASETVFTQVITVYDDQYPEVNFSCEFNPLVILTSAPADCPNEALISLEEGQVIHPNDTWTVAGVVIPSLSGCILDNCATDEYINIEVVSIVYDDENLDCSRGITITFEISDACGNVNPTPFVCEYLIIDDEAPTWETPEGEAFPTGINITISCDDVDGLAFANSLEPEASDECSDVTLVPTPGSFVTGGDCPQEGTITNTWIAYDDCGNPSTTFTQVITVIDSDAPTFDPDCQFMPLNLYTAPLDLTPPAECPEDATISLTVGQEIDNAYSWTVAGVPIPPLGNCIADNCAPASSIIAKVVSIESEYDEEDCHRTITVSFELRDPCGNVQEELFVCVYNIIDNEAPTFYCEVLRGGGPTIDDCYATEEDAEAAALELLSGYPFCITDECTPYEDLSIVASTSGDPCEAVVTVTATDCAGNIGSISFNTRIDGTPPAANPSALQNCFPTQGEAEAAAIAAANFSDNCSDYEDLDIDVVTMGDCPNTSITVTATDECGNSASVTFFDICIGVGSSVEITTEASNGSSSCESEAAALQAWLDNHGGAIATGTGIVWSYSTPVFVFNCGAHSKTATVTFTATDGCGYTDTSVASFTVTDNTAPSVNPIAPSNLTCSTAIPAPNPGLVTGVSDNCDASPTVALFGTSDNGASGCPGSPRIVIHTYSVTDDYCNTAYVSHMITIVDNIPPTFTAPANTTINVNAACVYDALPSATGDVTDEMDNCTPTGPTFQAIYTDVVSAGVDFQVKWIITRTWTLLDACGNAAIPRTQVITVLDVTPPTIVGCPPNANLPGSIIENSCGAYASFASPAFDDNCDGESISYELTGATLGSGNGYVPGSVVLNEGETTVTYTVTDWVGNTVSCSFTITVNCVSISGRLIWEHDDATGVKDGTVTLTPTAPLVNDISDVGGNYDLPVPAPGNYTITPVKNINRLNGVTSADATAIQNHVNGSAIITDPYKKVCADVNRSNVITTQDATLITQSIAGYPPALAVFNVFWRFVPTTFSWPLAGNNVIPPFPENIPVAVAAADIVGQDFFGMKIGDVNGSANPALAPSIPPLVWILQDQTLVAGTEIDLSFATSNFTDLASYQFALDFDPTQIKFVGFQPLGALPMNLLDNFGAYNAEFGELRNVWSTGNGTTLADGTPVFRAKFKVLATGKKLSEVLKLDNSEIECKAYSETSAPTDVKLVFAESVGTDAPSSLSNLALQLLQNRPNPFTDATTIGFILPEACEANIRILDISGRELSSYTRQYTAGYHELDFRMENAASYGMLFCELVTPQGKRTIKMMTAK